MLAIILGPWWFMIIWWDFDDIFTLISVTSVWSELDIQYTSSIITQPSQNDPNRWITKWLMVSSLKNHLPWMFDECLNGFWLLKLIETGWTPRDVFFFPRCRFPRGHLHGLRGDSASQISASSWASTGLCSAEHGGLEVVETSRFYCCCCCCCCCCCWNRSTEGSVLSEW